MESKTKINVHVLTVSDRVSAGQRPDQSLPKIVDAVKQWQQRYDDIDIVVSHSVDELQVITKTLQDLVSSQTHLIITTGGTGFASRDVTPEATKAVIEREAPGLIFAMMSASLKVTSHAMLSRSAAGIAGRSLIVNLPGSPKGAQENLQAIFPALYHALQLVSDIPAASLTSSHDPKQSAQLHEHNPHQHHQQQDHHHHHHHHDHDDNNQSIRSDRNRKTSRYPMVPVEEALDMILPSASPTSHVKLLTVSQLSAVGRVLAAQVYSPIDIPEHPTSMKDGYAVRAEDGVGTYDVKLSIHAGANQLSAVVGKYEAVEIMTGAVLPSATNAVVMVENVTRLRVTEAEQHSNPRKRKALEPVAHKIVVDTAVVSGQDIRQPGSDIRKGDLLMTKQHVISPTDLALLASVGIKHVSVFGSVKVCVMSTGNEIVNLDNSDTLGVGQVFDSNRPMLISHLKQLGFVETDDAGICSDNKDLLQDRLSNMAADVVITTGGVSMGESDYLQDVLGTLGTVHFGRVLMKPGKPTTYGTIADNTGKVKHVFCLPGNPVSASVSYHLFVVPLLKRLAGLQDVHYPTVQVRLLDTIALDPYRPEYHRAVVRYSTMYGCLVGSSTGQQHSSRLQSVQAANGLLKIPQGHNTIQAGRVVDAILIDQLAPTLD